MNNNFLSKWHIILDNFFLYVSFVVPILWYYGFDKQLLFDISWYALLFVMLIRPLSDFFKGNMVLKKLIRLRKWLWVMSAMVIVTNLFFSYGFFFLSSEYFASRNWDFFNSNLFARLWEITWLILLITSNDFSIRLLWRWWKRIQRLSYLYFISWGVFLHYIWKTEVIYHMLLVLIFWIFAYYQVNFDILFKKNREK